jgi:hypothetical protein
MTIRLDIDEPHLHRLFNIDGSHLRAVDLYGSDDESCVGEGMWMG